MPDTHDPNSPSPSNSSPSNDAPQMGETPESPADSDRVLTWAALLGRWTDFAQSALALPEQGDAGRVRQSVVSIITLQAITHALGEVDLLDPAERAVALDRAEILIKQHAGEIHSVWRGEPLPDEIRLLIHDARQVLHFTQSLGVEWRLMDDRFVARHPGDLVLALTTMIDAGPLDLFLPTPGTTLFATSPVAFARFADGTSEDREVFAIIESFLDADLERETGVIPRQVYRQFDFGAGRAVRDVVLPMNVTSDESAPGEDSPVPAGQPQLIAAILDGESQPVPLAPRRFVGRKARDAGTDDHDLPVVFQE